MLLSRTLERYQGKNKSFNYCKHQNDDGNFYDPIFVIETAKIAHFSEIFVRTIVLKALRINFQLNMQLNVFSL